MWLLHLKDVKKTLFFLLYITLLIGCEKKKEPEVISVPKIPEIVNLSGGIVKVKTSDEYKELITETIKLDTNNQVPDKTKFRVVSDSLLISINRIDWIKEEVAETINGKINLFIKPNQTPGLYRVTIYPLESNNQLTFSKNINAKFFVEVTPGIPNQIKDITTESFEDLSPYNSIKDLNESWIISANPDLIKYISVGPIVDKFGNNVSEGLISLTASDGQIISDNPAQIADGFAYFSYKPSLNIGEINFSAQLVNENIVKNISMKSARPTLEVLDNIDFLNMTVGESRTVEIRIKNSGSQIASSLNISVSFPFVLGPELSDSCKERGSLRSQEICKVRVQYTRTENSFQNGTLKIISQPENFQSSSITRTLLINESNPPNLVLSESSINFDTSNCGIKKTKEIFVTNLGTSTATNINVTQPTSSVIGQPPYFKIIIPNKDLNPDPDLNNIINCGNEIPAGRKCRIVLEFEPLTLFPNNPVTGFINADSIPSLAISMNGQATPGLPTGEFQINFYKPIVLTSTSTMFAQNGQKTIVKVGPIADSCGNNVSNGSVVSASVSAGSLNTVLTTTNSGYAEFTWNAVSSPEFLGNQTISVTSNNYTKQASLIFQGVNLTLSGPTSLGQIIIEQPTNEFTYLLKNTGNIRADNISVGFTEPLYLKNIGTCGLGISVNQQCSFTVGILPSLGIDYNSSIFVNSSTPGINNPSINNIILSVRNKAVLSLDLSKYLFNDGTNSSLVSRTIILKNNGPAISYNTSIMVESPYVIDSNNCPSTMNMNQTCQLTISSTRSASIGAGYKKIIVSNEIDSNAVESALIYSELIFSNNFLPSYKRYACLGPFTISSVGINNVLTNLAQTISITLDSDTGKALFYSDNTCNSKILSTSILQNSNSSQQFYIRSITADTYNITGTSGSFPVATRLFSFEDIKNDLLTFKPALAVRNTSCILCHSNIKGNIVTDFNFSESNNELTGHTVLNYTGSGDYIGLGSTYWNGINNSSMSYGTSYIEGKIYAKKVNLGPISKSIVESTLSSNKPTFFDSTTPTVITTISDYLNSFLPHRTSYYLNLLLNYVLPDNTQTFSKDPRVNPLNISIREVNNVFINAPSADKITSFLDSPNSFKYYKWDDNSSYDLNNFQFINNNYFGNIPDQTMNCDGDLFIDGPVYFKNLNLRTISGCRIYSTGVVFIEATDSPLDRDGIPFIDQTPTSNIQITSSKGILLGVGLGTYNNRKANDTVSYGPALSTMDSDYFKIKDLSNNLLLKDASDSGNRKVSFNHILLNAPRVDSRYSGDFNGVLITQFSMWSLGHFTYFYDPIFNNIPILPFLDPNVFFSVQDCILNNIDLSILKDVQTNYRSCPN